MKTLFLFISMGFVLASPISAGILLCYIPIIVVGIRNEERVLSESLPGYAAYCKKE